jgi:hypothetical protein
MSALYTTTVTPPQMVSRSTKVDPALSSTSAANVAGAGPLSSCPSCPSRTHEDRQQLPQQIHLCKQKCAAAGRLMHHKEQSHMYPPKRMMSSKKRRQRAKRIVHQKPLQDDATVKLCCVEARAPSPSASPLTAAPDAKHPMSGPQQQLSVRWASQEQHHKTVPVPKCDEEELLTDIPLEDDNGVAGTSDLNNDHNVAKKEYMANVCDVHSLYDIVTHADLDEQQCELGGFENDMSTSSTQHHERGGVQRDTCALS